MNYSDEFHVAVEAVASSPKLLAGVSAATTSLGVASFADLISGALSGLAILTGVIASMLLGRVHWISYKNQVLQNKILLRQLRDIEGEPALKETA